MRINLDHNEFLDFICVMLYDILKNDDYLQGNENFNELVDNLEKKGITPLLFKYYLSVPSEIRKEYKSRFKKSLKDNSKMPGTLFIYPSFENLEEDIQNIINNNMLNEKLEDYLKGE